MMKYFFALCMMLCVSAVAMAQETRLDTCLRQIGNKIMPYDYSNALGAKGTYRFSVNELFDADFCSGPRPAYRSYDWSLCDFRGLAAAVSRVRSIDDIVQNPSMQTRIMRQNLVRKFNRHVTHGNIRNEMSPDVEASLIYTKGRAATKLFKHTNILAVDRLGNSMRNYEALYRICSDDKNPVIASVPHAPSTVNISHNAAVRPYDLAWKHIADMPEDIKTKIIQRTPVLRLVFRGTPRHVYAHASVFGHKDDFILGLKGVDFCRHNVCTFYAYSHDLKHVKIFYGRLVHGAWQSDGLYVDGFYKKAEALS